tara:strand:+ start:23621 stop:23785 length:165 start_codon:yes stop_codon:yes gene_type:complete
MIIDYSSCNHESEQECHRNQELLVYQFEFVKFIQLMNGLNLNLIYELNNSKNGF